MTRLRAALDEGLHLPQGRALVLRPPVGFDLSAFDDVQVVHGFKPDYDHFEHRGFAARLVPDGTFSVAFVSITRSKEHTRDLLSQAARSAPFVIVDGQKTDGIESHLRDVKARRAIAHIKSKAHGKLFAFHSGDGLEDWRSEPNDIQGFQTIAGVFSAGAVDPGSALLANALPDRLPARVADFGAGWGYLSHAILDRSGVRTLHIVEAEALALGCARDNIKDDRATFHWADATNLVLPEALDAVIMNPPFHQGRAADSGLGQAFIEHASRCLAPHGRLWCVANRHLPYEDAARRRFGHVSEIAGDTRFKVLLAERPKRQRR